MIGVVPAGAAPPPGQDARQLLLVHDVLAGLASCSDLGALRVQVVPPLLGLTAADAGWLGAAGLEGGDVLPPGLTVAAERLRREAGNDPALRWHPRGDGYLARLPLLAGARPEGELWLTGDAEQVEPLGASAALARLIGGQLGLAIAHLRQLDATRAAAERDPLTGLANQAHLRRALRAEFDRARRYDGGFALVLADVDGLEALNARHGREAGDAAVRGLAALFGRGLRACDFAARRGGGELALLLPQTDLAGARRIAERLAQEARALDVRGAGGAPIGPVAVSFGIAAHLPADADLGAALARAEDGLRRAKAGGEALASDALEAEVPAAGAGAIAARVPAAAREAEEAGLAMAREFERLKAEFLGRTSHELRTPLSAILGYAELLQDNLVGPLTLEQSEFVGQIETHAQRLVALVEAMLDAARHEHGPIDLVRDDVDLVALCGELVTALEPAARRARTRLDWTPPAGGPLPARIDRKRMRQAVAALVENAIKFTPEGGRVDVRMLRRGKDARIEVRDDGIGIPPGFEGQIFQKFYQVDGGATRMRNGAGLGLYVARAIVEAHGGVIGVESEQGKGSTFWITLPSGAG